MELEPILTQMTPDIVKGALMRANDRVLPDEILTNEQITVLLAQSCLETGWWKTCYCYNLGNAKAHAGWEGDYTYFPCGESNLTPAQIREAVRLSRPRVDDPTKPDCLVQGDSVLLWAKHPWAKFRGWVSIEDAAEDYLLLLRNRFSVAWPAVLAADPKEFVRALKSKGYFTASFERYWPPVVSLYQRFLSISTEEPTPAELVTTHIDREFIWASVAIGLQRSVWRGIEESFQTPREFDDS